MNKNREMRELKIFVRKNGIQRRISTWRFFPNLGFCFRMDGHDWEDFDYEQAIQICKRVVTSAKTNETIQLRGTMVDELDKEDKVLKLFNGEKVVLR